MWCKNSDTLGYASCATFLFLPHFDLICDLLLNRRTATWNLFVKWKRRKYILKYGKNGTIVQQSLFEVFLYIAVTIFSFHFVKTLNVILILLSFYFGQILLEL